MEEGVRGVCYLFYFISFILSHYISFFFFILSCLILFNQQGLLSSFFQQDRLTDENMVGPFANYINQGNEIEAAPVTQQANDCSSLSLIQNYNISYPQGRR